MHVLQIEQVCDDVLDSHDGARDLLHLFTHDTSRRRDALKIRRGELNRS
jgi:hypothetical protein